MTTKEAIEIAKEGLKEAEQALQTGPLMNYITEREDLHDEIKPILEKAKKHIEANRRLIEIAERFEGAVEVELRVDGNTKPYVPIPYVIEGHKNDFYSNRTEYTKLYAIPKKQDNNTKNAC